MEPDFRNDICGRQLLPVVKKIFLVPVKVYEQGDVKGKKRKVDRMERVIGRKAASG